MDLRYYPVDIDAIKKYGLDKWHEEFFWPVSDREYLVLCQDVLEFFKEFINAQPDRVGELLLVQAVLRAEYWNFFHVIKAVERIKRLRGGITYSHNLSWYYKDVVEDNIIEGNISKIRTAKYNFHLHDPFRQIVPTLKRLAKNTIYNSRPFEYFARNNKERLKACGSVGPLMRRYIKDLPYWVDFTSQDDWLPKNRSYAVSKEDKDNIQDISEKIVSGLLLVAKKNKIKLSDNNINYLTRLTYNRLSDADAMLHLTRTSIRKDPKIVLLMQNLGNAIHRSLCIVLRERGSKVISFNHGGQIGLYHNAATLFSEFAISDKFVTYTSKSAELYRKIKAKHRLLKNNKVEILSAESSEYLNLWKVHSKKPLPKSVKSVMIVGSIHNQYQIRRPQDAGNFSLTHLDLELRSIKAISNAGYKIFYKAHPLTMPTAMDFFKDSTEVISKGVFEDYLDKVDAFVFISARTTAFKAALCTNKLVVAFRMAEEPFSFFPEVMALLGKRCKFVYGDFDERNRISFDERELLDALNAEVKKPDDEFIEKYLFPENKRRQMC